MTENIIRPPIWNAVRPKDQDTSRAERSLKDAARLRTLKEGPPRGKRGHTLNIVDRFRAGLVNQELVDKAKERKTSSTEIADRFGGRFQRYATGRMKTIEATLARDEAGKLDLKGDLNKYLKLAEVLAPLAGVDPIDAQVRVARSTSLWSERPDAAGRFRDEPDFRADRLALLLNEMAASLIRKHDLAGFFSRARRVCGQLDLHTGAVVPSIMPCVFREAYDEWNEHWQEPPLLPSIPLLWHPHGVFRLRTRVSEGAIGQPEGQFVPDGTVVDGPVQEIEFQIHREVRLAIAPRAFLDDLAAMFESRAHVTACLDGANGEAPIWPSAELMQQGWLLLDDGWHLYEIENFDLGTSEEWLVDPVDPMTDIFPHWYLTWTQVDGPHVRYWLEKAPPGTLVRRASGGDREVRGEFWYAKGTVANEIEAQLASGDIEIELGNVIETMNAALHQRETEWRDSAELRTQRLIHEWSLDNSDNHSDEE